MRARSMFIDTPTAATTAERITHLIENADKFMAALAVIIGGGGTALAIAGRKFWQSIKRVEGEVAKPEKTEEKSLAIAVGQSFTPSASGVDETATLRAKVDDMLMQIDYEKQEREMQHETNVDRLKSIEKRVDSTAEDVREIRRQVGLILTKMAGLQG